ncbi:MAG TPA: hypothetical protein VFA46_17785 [Actinomycetes bacterium]|nr:hypothetical protein [Actinomycetes bacterium]
MSGAPTSPADDALAPVRGFLLARARAEADRLRVEATTQADALLAEARQHAAGILDAAREQGERDGEQVAAAVQAQARRRARSLLLAAQRQAYQALRQRGRAAARALRKERDYPALRERLARTARQLVGPDAAVTEAPGGGVVAQAPGRRVDCALGTLADRAVDALGVEVEGLWAQ